ncbi:putative indole-3-acetic acid-amido synthetase GH3.9 [Tanacetum coccineum]
MDSASLPSYNLWGGLDMICSGRDNIETSEHFKDARETVKKLDLNGLVVIGGDDSNMYECLQKTLKTSTPCGLPARTVVTIYYKIQHFKSWSHDLYNDQTSPDEPILCDDSNQRMYRQLLAGLIHRQQVKRLGAVFASALQRAISFFERD